MDESVNIKVLLFVSVELNIKYTQELEWHIFPLTNNLYLSNSICRKHFNEKRNVSV